jgi:hypothetical protein
MPDNIPAPRFPGRIVSLAGVAYTIAALSVRDLKRLRPKLDSLTSLSGLPTIEQWDDILEILLAAFQRNYPEVTREQLEELVDLSNFAVLISSVMGSAEAPARAGAAS